MEKNAKKSDKGCKPKKVCFFDKKKGSNCTRIWLFFEKSEKKRTFFLQKCQKNRVFFAFFLCFFMFFL